MEVKDKLKITAEKPGNSTGRNKSKDIGERRKIQKIPGLSQTPQTKNNHPK